MTEEVTRIERIISKHVHDVRNSMNCIYWEAVLLAELSADPEVGASVKRMNLEISEMETAIQALQYKLSKPAPATMSSVELLKLWQEKIAPLESEERRISWASPPEPVDISLDAPALIFFMQELALAGWKRSSGRPLEAAVTVADRSAAMVLREPVSPAEPEDMEEGRRFVAMRGGTLTVSEKQPEGGRTITISLAFP